MLAVLSIALLQSGVRLKFQAQPNIEYVLQGSSNLTNWTEMEVIGPSQSTTEISRTFSPTGPSRFYRVLLH
jgi:hypothetical protein